MLFRSQQNCLRSQVFSGAEALREFSDYRMLVYAIVLILVMLATNNDTFKSFLRRLKPGQKKKKEVV